MKKKNRASHGVRLLIRAVVRDPEGKSISDTGQKPSKSFVINFLKLFHAVFDGPTGIYYVKATDGSQDIYYYPGGPCSQYLQIDAPINNGLYGLVVGTGDTAEDNEDYKLETQLTEGVGAGNITHGEVVFEDTAVVGVNVDLVLKRAFSNNTGSTITVKEAGIYNAHLEGGSKHYFCIVRDVLAAPVEVPDKCSLTIYYTLRTTV